MAEPLLEIRGLKTHFATEDGMVQAVDGVDLTIARGETLGVVGESGCGKTVTALTVLKLIAMPPGRIVAGQILWQGRDLVPLRQEDMNDIRSKEIAIIFQEPMTSLNPVYTVGEQIAEVVRRHEGLGRRAALAKTVDMLKLVQIPNPQRRVRDYPHQFSGGMRQRVMIAMALACNPKLLIADEPTTALDVTIQAQILELLDELRKQRQLAVLLITHDLGVVAEVADRVAVMYTGRIVEESPVDELFARPKHPYTEGLLRSVPKLSVTDMVQKPRLETIEGVVPRPTDLPPGCHFAPRCRHRMPRCTQEEIPLYQLEGSVQVRCVLYDLAAAVAADHEASVINEKS
jgi:peptide/nickel transport system ATP-binding protein